ncbi:DUF3089 domain-containing protein [Sphingorhabdus sp.]|uniref:DUF3089 domain-containing protein n=1 Tax=Sphingorhabdus sp. TaxID=1902408 RepID=UPI0039832FD7
MARKFLYIVASLIVLVIAGGFVMRIYESELTELAFVPTAKFEKQAAFAPSKYAGSDMWFARPGKKGNPADWLPTGAVKAEVQGSAAIFFVHPTSYIGRDYWNAPLDDVESQDRARLFLRGLASPFAGAGEMWAPRYRQAAIGSFLTTKPEGQQALDAAYQDVLLAFDEFVSKVQKDRPIILAGHSQGALHLTHLLKDRVAGKPIAKRIVAAYVVGWPISVPADMLEMGLPACASPDDTSCIMAWQSFAEPAEYDRIVKVYNGTTGFNGTARKDTPMLCTNPLNGGAAPLAEMKANLGTLKPDAKLETGELVVGAVPARCDDKGFLLIGDPPEVGPYVLPGNNYHVYDIPLFWANVRADATWRLQKFLQK